jgi:hypothetical protein
MSAKSNYIHPAALAALTAAERAANLQPVITQTQGDAPDSKGFHAADGRYQTAGGNWHDYCAAIDFSVRQKALLLSESKPVEMNDVRIRWFLYNLAKHGFVAWYRRPSQGFEGPHIHAIYCGVKMKPALQGQVLDFLDDKDGLRGHREEEFWTAPSAMDAKLRAIFLEANP